MSVKYTYVNGQKMVLLPAKSARGKRTGSFKGSKSQRPKGFTVQQISKIAKKAVVNSDYETWIIAGAVASTASSSNWNANTTIPVLFLEDRNEIAIASRQPNYGDRKGQTIELKLVLMHFLLSSSRALSAPTVVEKVRILVLRTNGHTLNTTQGQAISRYLNHRAYATATSGTIDPMLAPYSSPKDPGTEFAAPYTILHDSVHVLTQELPQIFVPVILTKKIMTKKINFSGTGNYQQSGGIFYIVQADNADVNRPKFNYVFKVKYSL